MSQTDSASPINTIIIKIILHTYLLKNDDKATYKRLDAPHLYGAGSVRLSALYATVQGTGQTGQGTGQCPAEKHRLARSLTDELITDDTAASLTQC